MRKIIICFLISLVTLIFASCAFGSDDSSEYDPHKSSQKEDRKYNEETLVEILECFDSKDAETLKNMFSTDIQSKYDLEGQIEKAFEIYDDTSVSYDGFFDYGAIDGHKENGVYTEKRVGAKMEGIKTENGNAFIIEFQKYIVFDEDESKLGLYQIRLCAADNPNLALALIGSNQF